MPDIDSFVCGQRQTEMSDNSRNSSAERRRKESYLRILDSIILRSTFPKGASITSNNCRMTKVGVHTIKS